MLDARRHVVERSCHLALLPGALLGGAPSQVAGGDPARSARKAAQGPAIEPARTHASARPSDQHDRADPDQRDTSRSHLRPHGGDALGHAHGSGGPGPRA